MTLIDFIYSRLVSSRSHIHFVENGCVGGGEREKLNTSSFSSSLSPMRRCRRDLGRHKKSAHQIEFDRKCFLYLALVTSSVAVLNSNWHRTGLSSNGKRVISPGEGEWDEKDFVYLPLLSSLSHLWCVPFQWFSFPIPPWMLESHINARWADAQTD